MQAGINQRNRTYFMSLYVETRLFYGCHLWYSLQTASRKKLEAAHRALALAMSGIKHVHDAPSHSYQDA
eukprot:4298878-Alexandrium_andersonii.AAC.1